MLFRSKITNGKEDEDADSRENNSIPAAPGLETIPISCEGDLVDMTVDPIAVFEIVIQKAIDGVYRWKKGDEIFVVTLVWQAWGGC